MNAAQLHLALNHLPIFATLFGIAFLLLAFVRVEDYLKSIGLWFLVISALSAIPVYLSGEPAEEIIEHRQGVQESVIHDHEESAELAFLLAEILGGLSLGMLFLRAKKRPLPNLSWVFLSAVSAVILLLFLRTAHLGGQIRHDELRSSRIIETEPSKLSG